MSWVQIKWKGLSSDSSIRQLSNNNNNNTITLRKIIPSLIKKKSEEKCTFCLVIQSSIWFCSLWLCLRKVHKAAQTAMLAGVFNLSSYRSGTRTTCLAQGGKVELKYQAHSLAKFWDIRILVKSVLNYNIVEKSWLFPHLQPWEYLARGKLLFLSSLCWPFRKQFVLLLPDSVLCRQRGPSSCPKWVDRKVRFTSTGKTFQGT